MATLRRIVTPAAWLFYLAIVFEFIYMISPFALYFYSSYGPTLNFLHRSPATAWLTQFYLPHISHTTSPILNNLKPLAFLLVGAGMLVFLLGAVPVYWSKLRGTGVVTGGLYRLSRHPQYAGLAMAGLGTTLIWPRFVVLLAFVTMLFLYAFLARWEEEQCCKKFGEAYNSYRDRTGMFLPRFRSPRTIGLSSPAAMRAPWLLGLYASLVVAAIGLALLVREYSLSRISANFTEDSAVLSPALLTQDELQSAYHVATKDSRVRDKMRGAGAAGKLLVYVIPSEWYLADLPMADLEIEEIRRLGGHHVPTDFDRLRYKVLFTSVRTHADDASGRDIVRKAYGLDPILLATVDLAAQQVIGIETPPPHVLWGDIPTPLY
ncbi:MAG: isoprenylcysteine carboxylmethyltransferase family protein [Gemmatimonadota bacterium]|nr:MAG: isoprenylcysteine carboxylmethyltransferase family protein [Gemmatimonadota bacterium]